jgi:hypothetical protein
MNFGCIMSTGKLAEILETRPGGFWVLPFGTKKPRFVAAAGFWVLS